MVRVINRQWVVLEEREGGLLPGSPEAVAAIERVRIAMNPDHRDHVKPSWSIKQDVETDVFRKCERCGSAVRGKTVCKPCAAELRQEEASTRVQAYDPLKRWCKECGTDITGFPPRSYRCIPCQTRVEKANNEARRVARKAAAAKRIAEQFGVLDQKVNPYPCYRCRGPITGKGPNSRFCTECGIAVRNERRAEHERRYRAEAKAARQVSA